jgi:hypothetical protein
MDHAGDDQNEDSHNQEQGNDFGDGTCDRRRVPLLPGEGDREIGPTLPDLLEDSSRRCRVKRDFDLSLSV